ARKLPAKVTGKSLQVRYWPTLALALALQPETERVVIVLGASANDRALEALVRDELREHEHDLKLTYLTGLPIDDLLERVSNLPTRTVMLDARQLHRWGIPLARVPTGTIVLNRVPTVWEAYRWRIVGGVSLIVLQSILIAMLLLHRKRRRMAEQDLRISQAQRQAAVLEE